jgi:hypothetical protein
MMMIQSRITNEKNIAQSFEQIFPQRRLYLITIMNTGIDVINTAQWMRNEMDTAVKCLVSLLTWKAWMDMSARRLVHHSKMMARMVELGGVLKAAAPVVKLMER